MPNFQIATIDNIAYTEGSYPFSAFDNILQSGESAGVLESYRNEAGYVVLSYACGFELAIPEHRIRYIAARAA